MKALGPVWFSGLALGLCVGVFMTAVLVETETIPSSSPAWKFIRGGSALTGALIAVIGGWQMRRRQAGTGTSGEVSDT